MEETGFLPLPLHQIREMARQLLGAVEFMHELGFIHTDIKPGAFPITQKISC